MTTESLPPENSSTGRSHSAAISRMIVIASSSSWAVDERAATVGTVGTIGERSRDSCKPDRESQDIADRRRA